MLGDFLGPVERTTQPLQPDLAKSVKGLEERLEKTFPRNPDTKSILCPKCHGKECAYCYGCGVIEVPKDYDKKIIILP